MLSSVTLDDNTGTPITLHQDAPTGKRWLTSVLGLRGIQSLRNTTSDGRRVRPQAHGGIVPTRFEDARQITLVGEIVSQVGIEDALNEFAQVAAPMIQTLDSGPALIKWQEGVTGNALQRLVKIDGDLDPPFTDGVSRLTYQAILVSEDPRAYSQTLQTVVSSPLSVSGGGRVYPMTYNWVYSSSGGGAVAFTNAGNRPTPATYRIFGMVVNPQIVLVGTGLKLSFIGTINAGDFLEVDVAARTVKLNGSSNRLNFYDPANSSWFELPKGVSNLQLVAGSFDASAQLTVLGRSAYA